MFSKTILSIYDRTGQISAAYRSAGYEVIQLDISLNGVDSRSIEYQPNLKLHGIIAAPPCIYFSKANTVKKFEINKVEALSLVDVIFRFIVLYEPKWWVIENPSESRLWRYIGEPKQKIKLSDYGYSSLKGTGLWGNFNKIKKHSKPQKPLRPLDTLSQLNRSVTPLGLGIEFFKANP